MQASQLPSKIPLPFANSGTKNSIPTASQIGITAGAASLTDGFPPLTMTPLSAGGVPPSGADFNGILNLITAVQQWQCAGGVFKYDSTFSTAIGGYPLGCVLSSSDGTKLWRSTVDNNMTDPDGAASANWTRIDNAHGVQIFNGNGSFVVPAGVTKIYISACGGGGGGGGAAGNAGTAGSAGGGGGGGAGQWMHRNAYTVTPGQSIVISIGGGGAAGPGGAVGGQGNTGATGGTTTLVGASVNISLTGGTGGTYGSYGGGGAGGPGGNGYPSGGMGDDGLVGGAGGAGGNGLFGGGGPRVRGAQLSGINGVAGYGPGGGGGGGAAAYSAGSATGGNGAAGSNGFALIEY